MKYALNHHWKFDWWLGAFCVGMTQFLVLVFLEIVNFFILQANDDILETIKDFLAFVIISDFDDYFFITVKDERLSRLISEGEIDLLGQKLNLKDLMKIETTTSEYARFKNEGNRLRQPDPGQANLP